jgi:hypothetical protein
MSYYKDMNLTAKTMLQALACLDEKLSKPVRLIMGGGGAMLLAHNFALSTTDIDAVPASGMAVEELDPLIKAVAKELSLPADWLNPFYSTFAHVLPPDYGTRLIEVGDFRLLKLLALSKEDLLVMKCFAARQKDVVHARSLVKKGADLGLVKRHLKFLQDKRIPGNEKALKFLAEIETFFADQEE